MMNYILEFRRRLIRVFCVFGLNLLVSVYFSNSLFTCLISPLQRQLLPGHSIIAIHLASVLLTPLSIAFHATCLATMPYLLWQIWQFVHPALYGSEKSFLKIPLFASLILLFLGMAFAYWLILPFTFRLFINHLPSQIKIMADMAYSINFIARTMALFGICFQIPLICFLLVSADLISYQSLKRSRPYVTVGAFTAGMLLTPPDVISQILLAVPLWMLFESGLLVCSWQRRSSSSKQK